MDKKLLDILACPVTHQPLALLGGDKLKALNAAIAGGGVRFGDHEQTEALREALRTQDLVGRFGGEEFLLILPATDLTGAWALAERIRRHIDEGVSVPTERGDPIRFNISIGVAALGEEDDFAQLLARTDRALYAAKAGGRNRVETA